MKTSGDFVYDHSFTTITLSQALQKGDFLRWPILNDPAQRQLLLQDAVRSAFTIFDGTNPLQRIPHARTELYRFPGLSSELVARKVYLNLKRAALIRPSGRSFIVATLALLLSEGVPYRIYKLDIKHFYESIPISYLIQKIEKLASLDPITSRLLFAVLNHFQQMGGLGIPRGLALSALLGEISLHHFDELVSNNREVFYYRRYVDDIVLVTSSHEDKNHFQHFLAKCLPPGLAFNEHKTQVIDVPVIPGKGHRTTLPILKINYLGYEFTVYDPIGEMLFRVVEVDIAPRKLVKYKTKISRAFAEFMRTANFRMLNERVAYLTSNFSIHDFATGQRKLAGIFYSYPQLTEATVKGLRSLDAYLRKAILSPSNRLSSRTSKMLSQKQKRRLLSYSFERGHKDKIYRHFRPTKINEIQKCWRHE